MQSGRARLNPIAVAAAVGLTFSGPALACHPSSPAVQIGGEPADAIALAQVTDAKEIGLQLFVATMTVNAPLLGAVNATEYMYQSGGAGSCTNWGTPKPGSYWVLFLTKGKLGRTRVEAFPLSFARQSGDQRLRRLNTLLPLGAARRPTPDEDRVLQLVEQKVRPPGERSSLSNFTRIYSRASPNSYRVDLFKSRTPARLIVGISEDGPTRESCRCELSMQVVEVEGLSDEKTWSPHF